MNERRNEWMKEWSWMTQQYMRNNYTNNTLFIRGLKKATKMWLYHFFQRAHVDTNFMRHGCFFFWPREGWPRGIASRSVTAVIPRSVSSTPGRGSYFMWLLSFALRVFPPGSPVFRAPWSHKLKGGCYVLVFVKHVVCPSTESALNCILLTRPHWVVLLVIQPLCCSPNYY